MSATPITIKVRFKESISSMAGSFAFNQVTDLAENLARPWLKTRQVEFFDAAEEARVKKIDAARVEKAKAPVTLTPAEKAKKEQEEADQAKAKSEAAAEKAAKEQAEADEAKRHVPAGEEKFD